MLNQKKAPSLELITARMLKELPNGFIKLMHILNATLRIEYRPKSLKFARIIMITKPRKNPMDVSSYQPIRLLPIFSKLLEELIHKNINIDLNPQQWIPNHQFGFRQAHSTGQQCHRISDIINKAKENEQYFTAAFSDVSQALDKL